MDQKSTLHERLIELAGSINLSLTCECQEKGTIIMSFETDGRAMQAALGPERSIKAIEDQGPQVLPKLARSVEVTLKEGRIKPKTVTARFSANEWCSILQGVWPNSNTFDNVATAIRERNHYPMRQPSIPGGGGKSMTAQGQTKKEDSHSHKKHR